MKKSVIVILILSLLLSLCGCGNSKADYKIAIVQQLDHSSLNEICAAVEVTLNALAAEKGLSLDIQVFNGQNDAAVLSQIGAQVASGGFDMVIPIATTAAQYMVTAVEGKIPVIYSAVSDPENAGLTGTANVTGVSDALNTAFLMDMILAAYPDIRTVGLLYSASEPNSEKPIAEAKAYLDAKGIAYLEKTGTNASEILAAATALAGQVDAVFTPTDNVVMASEAAVAEILQAAGTAHFAGADSFVQAGAFAAAGVNYTDLGEETAKMAFTVLTTGQYPDHSIMPGGSIIVGADAAQALGIDPDCFTALVTDPSQITELHMGEVSLGTATAEE